MRSNGVFFSIAIAESSMAIASAILFKRGKWKKQKI
jgi:Na+-driven multidrug efflux pump